MDLSSATSAHAVRAASRLSLCESRVIDGAMVTTGPAFSNWVAAANGAGSDQMITSRPEVAAVPVFSAPPRRKD